MNVKETAGNFGMDLSNLPEGAAAGFFEHGNDIVLRTRQ